MRMVRVSSWPVVAATTLGLLLCAQAAFARGTRIAPQCGDTIGPGGVWEVTAAVGPCDVRDRPALTIVGPVTVDLSGHTISCAHRNHDDFPALSVTGGRARLSNGTVVKCTYGVRIEGSGRHRVRRVDVKDGSILNYEVLSDHNLLADSMTSYDLADGIAVLGHRNRVVNNQLALVQEGILVSGDSNVLIGNDVSSEFCGLCISGSRNRVGRNTIEADYSVGLSVIGDRNRVTRNDLSSQKDGVRVWGTSNVFVRNHIEGGEDQLALQVEGERHTLRGNEVGDGVRLGASNSTLVGNVARGGYVVTGTGNRLRNNTSVRAFAGFSVEASSNTLLGNTVLDDHAIGFWVHEGAHGNLLRANDSTGDHQSAEEEYGEDLVVDLRDDNPECGTNQWDDNRFGSRNQTCIGGTAAE